MKSNTPTRKQQGEAAMQNRWRTLDRLVLVVVIGLLIFPTSHQKVSGIAAQEKQEKHASLVKLIPIEGTVDESVDRLVTNTALELQNEAENRDEEAILLLEIRRGTSKFGPIFELAKTLTSSRLSRVRTVAWIPEGEKVDGHNAILALACKEIVMQPDAELGDIGRGEGLDNVAKAFVLSLADKKHNKKLSRALLLGMTDRNQVVLKIEIKVGEPGKETTESRVVTPEEHKRLLENNTIISKVDRLKEAGDPGIFSGSKARANDVLIVQMVEEISAVVQLYNLPPEAMRPDPSLGKEPKVALIKIDGPIEYSLEAFVSRQISRSVNDGANIIIFEIDSPGGYLLASTNLANTIAELDPKNILTVAYIPEMALSGAAIIALGCDRIYMGFDAQTGDAGPIEMGKGGQFQHAPEKIVSVLTKTLGSLARKKNRPVALAMAMADKELEVFQVTHPETGSVWYMSQVEIDNDKIEWQKGPIVPETSGDLFFTVTGDRAHELNLAERPVQDWDELKDELRIPPEMKLVPMGPTWVDTLVFYLRSPGMTVLLFVVGGLCIYLELHFMTGLLGIISALCFSLFFWSRFLGGTAGWLEVILFLLGLVCIVLEIFVIPGFGVFGVSGGLLLLSALILAGHTFRDFNTLPNSASDLTEMSRMMGTLTASIVSVLALALVMNRYLPHMPVFNKIILTPPGLGDQTDEAAPKIRPEFSTADSTEARNLSLLGEQGETLSVLRPAGKAQVGDYFIDVVSDGPFIEKGRTITIVEVSGNRIVVREV
jgi:membrane-bound serine protease (ClpP class)